MRATWAAILLAVVLLGTTPVQARCFGVPEQEIDTTEPWYVHLDIITSEGFKDEVEFGVAPGLTDGFEQAVDDYERILPGEGLNAYFLYPDAGGPFSKLNRSFTRLGEKASWLLQIMYRGPPTNMTLRWDAADTRAVPAEIGLRMVSFQGDEVDMKTTPTISFRVSEGQYNFRIVAERLTEDSSLVLLALLVYIAAVTLLILAVRRRRSRSRGGHRRIEEMAANRPPSQN